MEKFLYKKSAGVTALTATFSDFHYKKHCHEEYAMGVTLRGIQKYNTDGSLQASGPGGVMLFNPEQVHDGMSQEKTGVDYVMIYIDVGLFQEVTGSREPVMFSSPVVYHDRLRHSILSLTGSIFSNEEDALHSELLLALADNVFKTERSGVPGRNSALADRAKEMIFCNPDRDNVLKLGDVCKEIGMSKYQFIRMFRTETGISPYQYYLNCKVEKAKRLITESRDVYQAVAECGFVDLSHLNRHFKSRYGVTALDYMLATG